MSLESNVCTFAKEDSAFAAVFRTEEPKSNSFFTVKAAPTAAATFSKPVSRSPAVFVPDWPSSSRASLPFFEPSEIFSPIFSPCSGTFFIFSEVFLTCSEVSFTFFFRSSKPCPPFSDTSPKEAITSSRLFVIFLISFDASSWTDIVIKRSNKSVLLHLLI